MYKGAILTGMVSRSQETAAIDRLVRDGHAPAEDFKRACSSDREKIIFGQRKGFAYVSGGQVDWRDILRPMAWTFRGFQRRDSKGEDAIGPVTRWFRTNTFYRKPSVVAKIEATGNELSNFLPIINSGVAFLPGPYTFTRLVENSYYNDIGEMATDYSAGIAKNIEKLMERGYKCTLLLEPSVGYDISKGNFSKPEWYEDSVSAAKVNDLGVHFPLADAGNVIPLVENTSADFVGIDLTQRHPTGIETSKDLLFGVMDGADADIESNDDIVRQVVSGMKSLKFSGNFYVGPNDRLWDVPYNIGLDKIKGLSGFTGVDSQ